jgi:hypothetical protein
MKSKKNQSEEINDVEIIEETETTQTGSNGERALDFTKNRVEILTLDELRQTLDERNTGSRPMNGILHADLFSGVAELIAAANLPFEIEKIYAADNNSTENPGVSIIPFFEEQYGKGSLRAHLLRRITGQITIPALNDSESVSSVAISFHQKGIQVAFGQRVHVCSNMSIFGESIFSTYGDNGIKVKDLFAVLGDFIHKLPAKREEDVRIFNALHGIQLSKENVFEIIGDMFTTIQRSYIVQNGNRRREYVAPFLMDSVRGITEKFAKSKTYDLGEPMTAWELYNLGTQNLKPETVEIPSLFTNNAGFGNFLTARLGITA